MDTEEEGNKYMNLLMRIRSLLLLVLSLTSLFSLLFIVCHFSDRTVSIFPYNYSLTHTLERKYMLFLICNGILAFLAKTSSAASLSPLPDDDGFLAGSAKYSSPSSSAALADHDHDRDDRVVLLPRLENSGAVVEQERATLRPLQSEEADLRSADEDENDVVLEGNEVSETAPEEEEEEEAISTEELNKRIEEFIRKMKEEIRVEAQRQLIAV